MFSVCEDAHYYGEYSSWISRWFILKSGMSGEQQIISLLKVTFSRKLVDTKLCLEYLVDHINEHEYLSWNLWWLSIYNTFSSDSRLLSTKEKNKFRDFQGWKTVLLPGTCVMNLSLIKVYCSSLCLMTWMEMAIPHIFWLRFAAWQTTIE
jgi:hypothetical protein